MKPLDLNIDGAHYQPQMAAGYLSDLLEISDNLCNGNAGTRIVGNASLNVICSSILSDLANNISFINHRYRPVRAILFDKNSEMNWSLGWHQDRTICVKKPLKIDGYGPWTIKQGYHHVEPPFKILEKMITMRIHLDNVSADNAPLLIAKGTHKLGKITQEDIPALIKDYEEFSCLANTGDIWVYSTPILHASKKSNIQSRRRVIQIDFSEDVLDEKIEFLGI